MGRGFRWALMVCWASLALPDRPLADFEALGLRLELLARGPGASVPAWPAAPANALPDGRPALSGGEIREVWLVAPTERYGHGVLGDGIEAGGLLAVMADGRRLSLMLAGDSVFEDLMPRLADLDGDGRDEIVVVRSYLDAGAALAVYEVAGDALRLRAETPPIGLSHRWLNPVGAGDFDADGETEFAFVETPHIGGILRIYALVGDVLRQEGQLGGFSNHAMGSRNLGLAAVLDLDGDGADDLLLPDAGRRGLKAISFAGGRFAILAEWRHDAAIATDLTLADSDGNGRLDVTYGLRDGRWFRLRR